MNSQRSDAVKLTPLMQQYWDIKLAHEDKIVLFRMGDFFEMFHRDAEIAAPILGIALTSRNKKAADETPMCGVPHHSVGNSINKLLANGFKVAICDQVEDPKFAKGLVKRAVTRILSPGVVYDPETLDGLKPNYLASFDENSVSFLDLTTGEAFYFFVKESSRRERILKSLSPAEIVLPKVFLGEWRKTRATQEEIVALLSEHEDLATATPNEWPESAKRLYSYAAHMQGARTLKTLAPFERRELLDRMDLRATAIRHLELFETYRGEAKGALFPAVNRCKTASGARLLRSWLQFPLSDEMAIERRLDAIEGWQKKSERLQAVRAALSSLGDIHRRLGRISSPSVNPRDLIALGESVQAGLNVSQIASELVSWDERQLNVATQVANEIERTILPDAPVQLKNGGLIRPGVSAELDELVDLATNSQELILKLEAREREATGIGSLKVRFNNVFGYYIEITNTHKDKVPKDRYERKQTLANAERYMTAELTELESKVLSAQVKRIELEVKIFTELVENCLKNARELLKLASLWAEVDVVSAFAHLALEQSYCRPKFVTSPSGLRLKASRHPVIEQTLSRPFVANDIEIGRGGCLLLTGPNMAGKSTLMRQVAVTAILAQAGCFVPAREAHLPIFDRIFTRIGASDFLSEGLSTFMVEMKETAEMLANATENSLVILDEVGRGTSTYDGLSLAQAILEYLLENRKSMTLFATHYHELTALASIYPDLLNRHMRIHDSLNRENKGEAQITFLHQLAEGPANKSYGIHVARLAGLPATVTRRATQVLKRLEGIDARVETKQMTLLSLIDRYEGSQESRKENRESGDEAQLIEIPQGPLTPELSEIVEELKSVDIGKLTPLEALNQMAKWQRSLS